LAKKTTLIKPQSKKKVVNNSKIKIAASKSKDDNISKVKKTKSNNKTRYTKKELEHFRKIIIEERDQIIESAKANMDALVDYESGEYVSLDTAYSNHLAEQGTDEMEREKNYMFIQRDEKYLGYLQEALARIEKGTYGVCVDCINEPKHLCNTCPLIQKERLELVPITQHCIECKNQRG
jgi:RNA polymerase-binding transcription factor DksA